MFRMIGSAVVAFLISNISNTVYYAITADWNHLPFTRDEPIIGLFVAHHVLYAGIVTFLYPRYARTYSWLEAAGYGLLTGTLVFVPNALVVRGAWEVPVNLAFLSNTVVALTIGTVIGLQTKAMLSSTAQKDASVA